MSVWTTSLVSTQEVINMLLDKYRVECPASNFSLFVVKDNGGINFLILLIQFNKHPFSNREKKSKGRRVPFAVARDAGTR